VLCKAYGSNRPADLSCILIIKSKCTERRVVYNVKVVDDGVIV